MSGVSTYDPPLADLGVDAFERCGLRLPQLLTEHYQSLRRSMNLVQSRWSNRGVNLWKVGLTSVYMPQGVSNYPVDQSVVDVLDVYLRQYQMGAPFNANATFSTVINTAQVTVGDLSTTPIVGGYISVIVPVSVGGLILQSFYLVTSVPTPSSCTITAASNATSTVTNGGVVPQFTTQAENANVFVFFPNHGQVAGGTFSVQVATTVDGIVLNGSYPVLGITDANNFTITASSAAGYAATVYENGGLAQIAVQSNTAGQTVNAAPVDILLYPLSRYDWAAIPNKQPTRATYQLLGRSVSFAHDGTVADHLACARFQWCLYQLNFYSYARLQDANIDSGGLGDFAYRFYEAFTAEVATHLSFKFAAGQISYAQGIL